MILYALILVTAILLLYFKTVKPLDYWKIRGVKYIKPVPIFGNFFWNVLQRISFMDTLEEWYHTFPNERYFGAFQFTTPMLVIRDVDLIKEMAIRDFDHFTDHQTFISDELDHLWASNLFAKNGDSWRDMRTTLIPSFTGSKMRTMFSLIDDCCRQMMDYYCSKNLDIQTLEMKDMFTRFTNDAIATCAFGVGCNSFRDKENEFYKRGLDATDFSGLKVFKFVGYGVSPALMKLFGIRVISKDTGDFFEEIIGETIKVRQKQGVIRRDMIHLLMEARRKRDAGTTEKEPITIRDMTAQAVSFFLAGFDTSSALMVYVAYELTANRDIQERLFTEVGETLKQCNGKITYEKLMKMKYMEMVVHGIGLKLETLSKWPPSAITDRTCTKDYVINPKEPGEKPLFISKGTYIWFPFYATQRDPEFFPNPQKFDPERFNEENKNSIEQGTFTPFGLGPRICLGNRFAVMETKAIIFHLLSRFEFLPVKETVIPAVLSKKHFNLNTEGGMWIGLKKRNI